VGHVVRFPRRLRAIQPITAEQVEVRDALIRTLSEFDLCPACKGRGIFAYKGRMGVVIFDRCPCGGDDDNRIDIDGSDLGGAA
jgi:hypothetical protein